MFNIKSARKLLTDAEIFYGEDEEEPESAQTINMNDQWSWGCSHGQYVPNDRLIEVAELFRKYGLAGILYWVSKENDNMRSEFLDNNRFIDFVAHEEQLIKDIPSSDDRAYFKLKYTLGGDVGDNKK
jgi:hypothetical protein